MFGPVPDPPCRVPADLQRDVIPSAPEQIQVIHCVPPTNGDQESHPQVSVREEGTERMYSREREREQLKVKFQIF
jgi:hypothetical protein